jgi:MORN repeat
MPYFTPSHLRKHTNLPSSAAAHLICCVCAGWREQVVYQATYSGGWKANRMHGSGAYTDASGVKWEGSFRNGTYDTGHSRVVLNK